MRESRVLAKGKSEPRRGVRSQGGVRPWGSGPGRDLGGETYRPGREIGSGRGREASGAGRLRPGRG